MARFETDSHFRKFCQNLEGVLSRHPETGDLLVRQREQLRRLVGLETEFRAALIRDARGQGVYRDFVRFIRDRNILAARPYFRERHEVFTRYISPALKERNDKRLYRFRFNWSFVEWMLRSRRWAPGSRISKLARQIAATRTEILEQNLPLAISQARIFWGNTPKSHLSYMDIVQIQCQGLLLAIDKFVPPKDARLSDRVSLAGFRKFRAVAIGIMMRDRINAYSETLVHFFPKDRMKQYQANKALRRQVGEIDYEALALHVNTALKDSKVRTTSSEIQALVAAGSTVSADYSIEPDGETVLDLQAADPETRPDAIFEEREALDRMRAEIPGLALIERKVLGLHGVRA